MDSKLFMRVQTRVTPTLRRTWCAGVLLLLSTLLGCSDLQPLKGHGFQTASHGWWLEIRGERTQQLAPAVVLELPNAPYRARFADPNGIYFQASLPLVIRNSDGFATEQAGGLYVTHADPSWAQVWFSPVIGDPRRPEVRPVAVQVFQP